MKLLFVFFILVVIVHETGTETMNPFKFRKKTLEQFNRARRIIASGDITKILEVVTFIQRLKDVYKAKAYGPAANMYKLVWSRTLEQAAFEYVAEHGTSVEKVGTTLYHKDFIGFHWVGNIFDLLKTVVKVIPEKVTTKLKDWLDIIETLIIVIWMGFSLPTSYPIVEGDHFSAGEAAFAMRYEIGCYSNFLVALCFMKNVPYEPRPFLPGAACSSCPTHCEYHVNAFGDNEEGELCVPPSGYYDKQKAEVAEMVNMSSGMPIIIIILLVIIISIRK